MQNNGFQGLMDMIDGGGMGRSGQTFEGGPLSGFLNALGVRPQGYMDRLSEARPMARPRGMGAAPAAPMAPPYNLYAPGAIPAPPYNPYAPGAIKTTALPPVGQMSDEELMQIITSAMQRAQSGQRR